MQTLELYWHGIVPLSMITHLKAEDKQTLACFVNRSRQPVTVFGNEPIKSLRVNKLPTWLCFHRKYLMNPSHVVGMKAYEWGTYAVLTNGDELVIGRDHVRPFKIWLRSQGINTYTAAQRK